MWNELLAVGALVVSVVVILGGLLFLPKLFRYVFRVPLGLHQWEYRNPYDRTCTVCNRHEVNHCTPGGNVLTKPGWWEVFRDGNPNAKPCGRKPRNED